MTFRLFINNKFCLFIFITIVVSQCQPYERQNPDSGFIRRDISVSSGYEREFGSEYEQEGGIPIRFVTDPVGATISIDNQLSSGRTPTKILFHINGNHEGHDIKFELNDATKEQNVDISELLGKIYYNFSSNEWLNEYISIPS